MLKEEFQKDFFKIFTDNVRMDGMVLYLDKVIDKLLEQYNIEKKEQ